MASSTCITRDPMSGAYTEKITISCWIKICDPDLSNGGGIFMIRKGNSYSNSRLRIYLESGSNKLCWELKDSTGSDDSFLKSNARLRDVGAWYHICMSYDSGLSTAADRLKMWINGKDVRTEYGGFQSDDQVGSGFGLLCSSAMFVALGRIDENNGVDYKFDGSMAECYFIYDSTYDVSTFGETDTTTGEWKPKLDIASGITFGSQGFYFPFTNAADMKADGSGNSNTYTITGTLTQSKDSPSTNMSSLNPLDNYYANATFSNGNTKITTGSGREASVTATIPMFKGKYYWETQMVSANAPFVGIQPIPSFGNTASPAPLQLNGYGLLKTGKVETTDGTGGSTVLATYATYTTGDIIGTAVDLDSAQNKIYFYKNGTILGSSGVNITSVGSTSQGMYLAAFGVIASQDTLDVNFGNGSFGGVALTGTTYSGADGSSTFKYEPPTGYSALSTKGLNA